MLERRSGFHGVSALVPQSKHVKKKKIQEKLKPQVVMATSLPQSISEAAVLDLKAQM